MEARRAGLATVNNVTTKIEQWVIIVAMLWKASRLQRQQNLQPNRRYRINSWRTNTTEFRKTLWRTTINYWNPNRIWGGDLESSTKPPGQTRIQDKNLWRKTEILNKKTAHVPTTGKFLAHNTDNLRDSIELLVLQLKFNTYLYIGPLSLRMGSEQNMQ